MALNNPLQYERLSEEMIFKKKFRGFYKYLIKTDLHYFECIGKQANTECRPAQLTADSLTHKQAISKPATPKIKNFGLEELVSCICNNVAYTRMFLYFCNIVAYTKHKNECYQQKTLAKNTGSKLLSTT